MPRKLPTCPKSVLLVQRAVQAGYFERYGTHHKNKLDYLDLLWLSHKLGEGWSVSRAAKALGCDPRLISRLLRGETGG